MQMVKEQRFRLGFTCSRLGLTTALFLVCLFSNNPGLFACFPFPCSAKICFHGIETYSASSGM